MTETRDGCVTCDDSRAPAAECSPVTERSGGVEGTTIDSLKTRQPFALNEGACLQSVFDAPPGSTVCGKDPFGLPIQCNASGACPPPCAKEDVLKDARNGCTEDSALAFEGVCDTAEDEEGCLAVVSKCFEGSAEQAVNCFVAGA